MDYKFDSWQEALSSFQKDVEKELKEIRQHKAEMQQIKTELLNEMRKGKYLRDKERIILSAPEIVIGNVDPSGALYPGGSTVIVRGQRVAVEGCGESGAVEMRAPSISQLGVDPGPDGLESVVAPVSQVVSQARHIVLQSNKAEGYFSEPVASAGASGIRLHADEQLTVEAAVGSETKTKQIESVTKELEARKKSLTEAAADDKESVDSLISSLKMLMMKSSLLTVDEKVLRTSYEKLEDYNLEFMSLVPGLAQAVTSYSSVLSQLAETNRQIACVKKEKEAVKKGDDYKKNPTGAALDIKSERISMVSADGDGNLRDNEGAGLTVTANNVSVAAIEDDRKLKEKGRVSINAMNVEICTANNADEKYEKGVLKQGTYAAEGDVVIKSKNITMESVDYELKDDKLQEKALTKEGSVKIRAEKMDLSATDTEGKATGSLAMNAKAVSLRSMDVEKEKRTDDKLAAGSTMLLVAEKMFVGAKNKDVKSKLVQTVTEQMGAFADKTLEMQQGDGKAVLQLADGKAALSGSETQVYGKTTINAATEVKAELKAPKATIDNVEAKSSFKSPNISDGIAVPAAAAGSSLSTKMKAEDQTS